MARLSLIVESSALGLIELRCPTPGRVQLDRTRGEVITAGAAIGTLIQSQRAFRLVVPDGVRGELVELPLKDRWTDCGFGTAIAVISTALSTAVGASAEQGAAVLARGADVIVSPSHGTFYRSSGPGQPHFVEVGQSVEAGQTVGLVEVMKCFSPITFQPPNETGSMVVAEFLVPDGSEVQAGQPLLRLRQG
jgi:acetyl-CoA carboxylase biotin carboxyl carrier protein